MSEDLVTIEVSDGVADVRLNRPEKYNALNPEMFSAINQAGENLNEAKDVRAVVLSGNGNGFCAGLDMSSFARMADSSGTSAKQEPAEEQRYDPANLLRKRLIFGKSCRYLLSLLFTAWPTAEVLRLRWAEISALRLQT